MTQAILIIDPEILFCQALAAQFNTMPDYSAHYHCAHTTALNTLQRNLFDILLLNTALITSGEESPYRYAKQKNYDLILLHDDANQNPLSDVVDKGDPVLPKPFRFSTLLSTIDMIKRRQISDLYPLGGIFFSQKGRYIKNETGRTIPLTEKETEILNFFLQQKGQIISRRVFLETIWGYRHTITTHTLETHIYRLRQKIAKNTNIPDIIRTTPQGYHIHIPETK